MKRKIILSIIIFAAAVVLFLLGAFWYEKSSIRQQERSTYALSKSETALLQDGDIILREGYGLVSESIVKFLNEPYRLSHSGVVCVDLAKKPYIIHSLSASYSETDGVQPSSLKRFCKESQPNTLVVVRFKNKNKAPSSAIAQRAKYYCSKKIPFDNSFDLNTPETFYCTELLWQIFLDVYQLDLYPNRNNKSELGLLPFYDTTNFEIVINHQVLRR